MISRIAPKRSEDRLQTPSRNSSGGSPQPRARCAAFRDVAQMEPMQFRAVLSPRPYKCESCHRPLVSPHVNGFSVDNRTQSVTPTQR